MGYMKFPPLKRSCNLDNSIEWSTVSKAADKSNKRSITDSLLSIAHRMSFWTLTKAVSVEWKFLYADWNVSSKWCAITWSVSCMTTAFSTSFDTTFKYTVYALYFCNDCAFLVISVLYGLPANEINKLHRLQKPAATTVTRTNTWEHITPVPQSLHWLPVPGPPPGYRWSRG